MAIPSFDTTRVRNGVRRRASASPAWSLSLLFLSAMLLTYVWRFQDLFAPVRLLKVPVVSTIGAYSLFILSLRWEPLSRKLRRPVSISLLLLTAWMVLTVPFSLYPGAAFRFLYGDHLKNVVFFVILLGAIRDFADVRRLAAVHLFGALVMAVVYLAGDYPYGSPTATYDPNDMSLLLISTLPFAVFFAWPTFALWKRVTALVALLLLLGAVLTSGSRGGFVGLLFVVTYLLVRFRGMRSWYRIVTVVIVVVATVTFSSNEYWSRMSTLLTPKEDYNWSGQSDTGRLEIWKRGVGYLWDYPITGVGARQFRFAEGSLTPRARLQELGYGWKWSEPHNIFVQIGAELGVPGLIFFMLLLYWAWRSLQRAQGGRARWLADEWRERSVMAQCLTASLVGYVVSGMFLSHAYSAFMITLYALIAGLAVGGREMETRRRISLARVGSAHALSGP